MKPRFDRKSNLRYQSIMASHSNKLSRYFLLITVFAFILLGVGLGCGGSGVDGGNGSKNGSGQTCVWDQSAWDNCTWDD